MLVGMFGALGAALLADIRTQRANRPGLRAATRHVAYRRLADVGTVQIQPDAIGQFGGVLLFEAGHGTVQTLGQTRIARVDTVLMGLMRHLGSPWSLACRYGTQRRQQGRRLGVSVWCWTRRKLPHLSES